MQNSDLGVLQDVFTVLKKGSNYVRGRMVLYKATRLHDRVLHLLLLAVPMRTFDSETTVSVADKLKWCLKLAATDTPLNSDMEYMRLRHIVLHVCA